MAFEELTKIETVARKLDDTGARASLVARSRHNGVAELQITVSLEKLARIGGDAKSTFIALVGRDDDAGRIRIKRATSKKAAALGARLAPRGKSLIFNLGLLPALPRDAVKSELCDVMTIDDATIEIALPNFEKLLGMRRALPAPKAAAPAQAAAASPRLPTTRVVSGNVTAAVMGDPAPGQSALDGRK